VAQLRLSRMRSVKTDTRTSIKARQRNAALTWDVPPPLDAEPGPTAPAGGAAGPAIREGFDDGSVHPIVAAQRAAFEQVASRHLRKVVQHLLQAEQPEVQGKWTEAVASLAHEAAMALSPSALAAHGVNDPRFYVKVKCLPHDVVPGDSCVVQGLVCRKNVAHRRMKTFRENPRILMLRGALETRRQSTNLSSFDTVLGQEEAHLKAAVDRIAVLEPDILLVEKSVGRFAQDQLLERGVALVLNVKRSLLDRLGRCTGAKVAESVEDLNPKCVARCKEFSVEPLVTSQAQLGSRGSSNSALSQMALGAAEAADGGGDLPTVMPSAPSASSGQGWKALGAAQGAKTLMTFRGTPLRMGCTILLKGESRELLQRLKAVTQFAVYAAYRLRLEAAFLADQGAAAAGAADWLAAQDVSALASHNSAGSAEGDGSIVTRSSGGSPFAGLEEQAGFGLKAASTEGALADASRSVDMTAGDVESGALLAISPHFALWPPRPEGRDEASGPAAGAETPAVAASPSLSKVATSKAAFKLAALSIDSVSIPTSPGALSIASGADAASSPAVSPRKQAPPFAVTDMDGAQRLFFSTASRNPTKKLLCEASNVQSILPYDSQDKSLAAYLALAFPGPDRKCAHPGCGDGFTHHLRTFLQGGQRVTLSVAQLPAGSELPGGESGQLWMWTRPLPPGEEPVAGVHRVLLSPDAHCLSFGHFLQLSFGVQHLESHGWHVHNEWVRYVGRGAAVACFHCEAVAPNLVALPPRTIGYSPLLQQEWLRQELQELAKEAQLAFQAVEYALQHNSNQAAGQQPGDEGILQSLLDGLASEQQVYNNDLMDIATLLRLNSAVPPSGSAAIPEHTDDSTPVRDHIQVAIVWELNRLRRSLMLTVLAWAASLNDPATYARSYCAPALERVIKSGVSALIADEAAAETAATRSPARSEVDAAGPLEPQLAPPSPLVAAPAAQPLRLRPDDNQSTSADSSNINQSSGAVSTRVNHSSSADSARAGATTPGGDLIVAPLPSGRLHSSTAVDAAKEECAGASGYAVTALADQPADSSQQPGSSRSESVAAAVDWRKVASQAQGGSPLAPAVSSPHGAVARLRAIFEQSSGPMPEENPTLQRQRTIEWLTAMSRQPSTVAADWGDDGDGGGGRGGRRASMDQQQLPSQGGGPWGSVLQRRRPASFFGGRAYPYLSGSPRGKIEDEQASLPGDTAPDQQLGDPASAEGVEDASQGGGVSLGGSGSGSQSSSRRESGEAARPLLGRGSMVSVDLVKTCSISNEAHHPAEVSSCPEAGSSSVPRSASAVQLSGQDGESDGDADSDGEETSLLTPSSPAPYRPAVSRSSHRRSISEPSTPDTPAPPGIRHDDVGSGELPHFEEWSTFVKGARSASVSPSKEPLLASAIASEEASSPRKADSADAALCLTAAAPAPAPAPAPARAPALVAAPEPKRPPLSALPPIGLLGSRRNTGTPQATAGTIPLAASGRVELGGRALLPPGIDDLVLSIFDDEPTSIISYFLANRTYQQYIEESLDGILHGKRDTGALAPAPAKQAAMKRAFSTSSDAAAMDIAAAAAAAAIPTSAAAASSHSGQASGKLLAPAAPLKSGASNLGPAPTAIRSIANAKSTSGIDATAVKAAATKVVAPIVDAEAAVASVGGEGSDPAPLPDLPPTADIASGLYGLHVAEEAPHISHDEAPAPVPASGAPTAEPAEGPQHKEQQQQQQQRLQSVVGTAAEALADAAARLSNVVKSAMVSPRSRSLDNAGDATRKSTTPPGAPTTNGSVHGASNGIERRLSDPAAGSTRRNSGSSELCSGSGSRTPGGEGGSSRATSDTPPAAAAPPKVAIPAAGAEAVGDRVLLCEERLDFRCSVEESPGMPWARAKFEVVAYFAPQFAELRRRWVAGGEAAFVASLSRCRKWDSTGGKSNAYFAKTRDERFIVKQLSRSEKASLLGTAPAHFAYLARRGARTCLAKILGVYQVTQKNLGAATGDSTKGAGRDGIMDLLVMENIFYGRSTSRIYDLKGSERSRLTGEEGARAGAVLMDDNLRRSNLSSPLLIDPAAYAMLEEALWADTAFLSALGVMDYSLLMGVDRATGQLVVGIIDFVRQYTWDKQLETWVKSTGILAGGKEPTVISPKQYCRRFRAAMASYFTIVPALERPQVPRSPDL